MAESAAVGEESIRARFPIRLQFRPFRRNPYVRNPAVEGVEQQDDAGGGPLVVPNWDGYRLARAGRFLYWSPAREGTEAVVAGDTLTPFAVRRPFRGFSRNPYLQHRDWDTAPAPAQPETHVPFLVRVPFRKFGRNPYVWRNALDPGLAVEGLAPFFVRRSLKGLGRNPYLRSVTGDEAPAAPPEAETHAPLAVRQPFRRLGRTPYVWNTAGDEAPAAPPEAETHARVDVRRPFRPYARRPQLGWHHDASESAGEAPVQRADVGGRVLVVPNWDRFRLARAARFSYWGQSKDIFVAPPPETDKPAHFIVRRPFRPYGKNPYLHHRDWQDGPPPPPVTFNAAWAKGANVLIRAGLVA